MIRNQDFFLKFWPVVAQQVTRHRAGADADILPLLRRLRVPRSARVLDVPCGYGRHAVLLARRGYRVTGVDISAELLKQARASWSGGSRSPRPGRKAVPGSNLRNRPLHKHTPEFIRGDMRRLRFRNKFDLALNLFTSFGYFGDRDDQRVLDGCYRALRPGGRLVLHVINRDFIMRHYRPRGRSRLRGFRLDERGTMDWASSVIRTEWTVRFASRKAMQQVFGGGGKTHSLKAAPRRMRGVTHLRIYSPHELQRMLERAGFRRVQAFGGLRGEAVSMDRRWLTFIASK